MPTRSECPFCSIIADPAGADAILDDEVAVAFLDRRPLFPGHLLLVPRRHCPTLLELPAEQVGPFFLRAQLLAQAVEEALEAEGTFLAINNKVSQSVPHLHLHLVPRRRKDGLKGFFWPRRPYGGDEERREVAAKLRNAVQRIGAG